MTTDLLPSTVPTTATYATSGPPAYIPRPDADPRTMRRPEEPAMILSATKMSDRRPTETGAPASSPHPSVVTALPGPRSAALLARQEKHESNARTYPRHFPFAVAEASGSYIRDLDGNVFIDFLTGAGVLSLG